mmetsp:Transcript_76602/g.112212  ORF Transcript_76602/g.112212 Transcript_76602/m.112212 type:complete len:216 (+) Transcript_76602:25-672(+)
MNHAHMPNCWTMFEKEEGSASTSDNATFKLVVRCLAPIAAGEEITISYLDPGQPRAELLQKLHDQYFIAQDADVGAMPHLGNPDELRRIGAKALYSCEEGEDTDHDDDAGSILPRVARVLARAMQDAEWDTVLTCCEDSLCLWKVIHRYPFHPKVGIWMMTAGLACLKSGKNMETARAHLDKAVKILGITHGKFHHVTNSAKETLALVSQLTGKT